MITPPLNLEAREFRKVMRGGITAPLLFNCCDDRGHRADFVLKLRHPATRKGNWEGTSLACELVCAVLGRAIGLCVPDYAIVTIPPTLPSLFGDEMRALIGRNVGPVFGSRYQEGMLTWDPDVHTGSDVLLEALEDVLVFDATVVNGDRRREKPNLLWRGDQIYAIDHSYAMPVHEWPESQRTNFCVLPDTYIQGHCNYTCLRGRARPYDGLLGRWRGTVSAQELQLLRAWIPSSWERRRGDLECIFDFLAGRTVHFGAITAELRRVMQ